MDLAAAQARLSQWLAANEALTLNTSYTISYPNGSARTVTRADGDLVRAEITYWHRVVNSLDANARGARERGYTTPSWI